MPLTIAGRSFRPRWWGVLLTAAGCAVFIAAGNWQGRVAQAKRVLQAQLDAALKGPARDLPARLVHPENYLLQRVAVYGTFLPRYTVLLRDKLYHGRVGYQVVTPLCPGAGKPCVLVNRGWMPGGPQRDAAPQVRTPVGPRRVEGLALAHFPRALDPSGGKPTGRVWINAPVKEFEAWSGLKLQPIVMEQLSAADDGLIRDWPRPDAHVMMNESYQLQWYSFAVLAVVLFFVLSLRRNAPPA